MVSAFDSTKLNLNNLEITLLASVFFLKRRGTHIFSTITERKPRRDVKTFHWEVSTTKPQAH